MAFIDGYTITPGELTGIWGNPLGTLAFRDEDITPWRQWVETYRLADFNAATPERLRRIDWMPTRDVYLRGIRMNVWGSGDHGVRTFTLTIPNVERAVDTARDPADAVGGANIPVTITITGTTSSANWEIGAGQMPLPITSPILVLGGDTLPITMSVTGGASSWAVISIRYETAIGI